MPLNEGKLYVKKTNHSKKPTDTAKASHTTNKPPLIPVNIPLITHNSKQIRGSQSLPMLHSSFPLSSDTHKHHKNNATSRPIPYRPVPSRSSTPILTHPSSTHPASSHAISDKPQIPSKYALIAQAIMALEGSSVASSESRMSDTSPVDVSPYSSRYIDEIPVPLSLSSSSSSSTLKLSARGLAVSTSAPQLFHKHVMHTR